MLKKQAPEKIEVNSQEHTGKKLPTRWSYYGMWGFDGGFGKYVFCVGGIAPPGVIVRLRQESDDWVASVAEAPVGLRGVWGASLSQIFAIGDKGVILFSSDGGDTWEQRNSPNPSTCFYRMAGDTNTRVWLCGDGGTLLTSEDLGLTWKERSLSKKRLLSIHRTDNGVLFVGTEAGEIFTSRDQGETWRELKSNTEQAINHIWSDSRTIYAACNGGELLTSADHERWSRERPFGERLDIESGSATLEGSVYLLGSSGQVLHRGPGGEWQTIFKGDSGSWWAAHSFEDRSTLLCGDSGRIASHTEGEKLQPLALRSVR